MNSGTRHNDFRDKTNLNEKYIIKNRCLVTIFKIVNITFFFLQMSCSTLWSQALYSHLYNVKFIK